MFVAVTAAKFVMWLPRPELGELLFGVDCVTEGRANKSLVVTDKQHCQ